jgi:adenylate cyclase
MYYPAEVMKLEVADRASLRALELDPELAEAHAARGMVLLASGRLTEAGVALEKASELDPQLFDARYFHGRALFQGGHFAEAAEMFRKATELRDDYQAAYFTAQALEADGDEESAMNAYRAALSTAERHMELNPDDPRAATMRAVSLARLGRRDEAVVWGERALEIDRTDGSVLYNVACLFSVIRHVDRALECLGEAIARGFGSPDWLARDPDLDPLRDDPRFERIMASPSRPSGEPDIVLR